MEEDYEICLVGNDVIALFLNIQSKSTGKIVCEEVEISPLLIEGFNYKLGTQYIAMNKEYTGDLAPIANLLPWRAKNMGVAPGMKCTFVNSKKDEKNTSSGLGQKPLQPPSRRSRSMQEWRR